MKLTAKIYTYILSLFCASLPFTDIAKALPNILLCVLVLLTPFIFLKEKFQTIKKPLLIILTLLLFIISITVVLGRWEDLKIIERLFYLPLILVLTSQSQNIRQHLLAFVLSAATLLTLSGFNLITEYLREGELILNTGGKVDELLLGARPYVSFMYLISAYACFYLSSISQKKHKLSLVCLGIIFIGFIFLIASRISILSLIFSLIFSTIYFFRKPKYHLNLFIGVFGLGTLLFIFSDTIGKRFFVNVETATRLASEPRYHIWECASSELTTDAKTWLFGKGFYGTEEALVNCYSSRDRFLSEDQQQWFVNSRFNTHNQYIDLLLSTGVISLVIFIFFLAWLGVKSLKNYYALNFMLFTLLFLFTENLLVRQIGLLLISIVFYFVLQISSKTNLKKQ